MIRKFTGIAVALALTGITGAQPAAAQNAGECGRYAIASCLTPNWQLLGYSTNTACRNAYFNYCYYGDPLDPIAYKPDAVKPDVSAARKSSAIN